MSGYKSKQIWYGSTKCSVEGDEWSFVQLFLQVVVCVTTSNVVSFESSESYEKVIVFKGKNGNSSSCRNISSINEEDAALKNWFDHDICSESTNGKQWSIKSINQRSLFWFLKHMSKIVPRIKCVWGASIIFVAISIVNPFINVLSLLESIKKLVSYKMAYLNHKSKILSRQCCW